MKLSILSIILLIFIFTVVYSSTSSSNEIDIDDDNLYNNNKNSLDVYNNNNNNINNDVDDVDDFIDPSSSSSSNLSDSSSSSSDSGPISTPTPQPPPGTLLATTFLYYFGGKPLCNETSCKIESYYYSENFACGGTSERGNWDNGFNTFNDPFPRNIEPSRLSVKRIDMVLSGAFNCDNNQPANTQIITGIQNYTALWNITSSVDCFCGSCFLNYTLSKDLSSNGFQDLIPSYNYGGTNSFTITVIESGICLALVQLKFFYDITPQGTTSSSSSTSGHSNNNNNNPNSNNETIKKWLIISGSITGGLILLVLLLVFIKKNTKKNQYRQLKDGKQIDIREVRLGERIGKGNFGEVFIGFWRGSKIAVKKLPAHNINENVQKEIQREIELMKNLRHPNIIQYLGSTTSEIEICIFTEFMSRGSLYSILHNKKIDLQWPLMVSMCMDAARGIIYLHNSSPIILHRDLKSHNLLVDGDYRVKVADFGLSTIEQSATMTACGTPCWSAPEVLRSQRYTERADVYSFGIVLWECATRMDPYSGLPPFQVIFAVGKEGLRPPIPKSAPPEFVKLIQDCWSENPQLRPTMEQILSTLESIDTNGWGEIVYPDNTNNNNNNNNQQNRIKNIV